MRSCSTRQVGAVWEQSAADVRGTALGGKAKAAARFVEIARNGAQGLEEAEGHMPGLAGKNGKDRGKLGSQRPVRRQGNEEHRGEGEIAQQRHGLEHIEERDHHHLRAAAVRRRHAVSEGEDERHAERQHHPQGCAQRVVRQCRGGQRNLRRLRRRERRKYLPRARPNRED